MVGSPKLTLPPSASLPPHPSLSPSFTNTGSRTVHEQPFTNAVFLVMFFFIFWILLVVSCFVVYKPFRSPLVASPFCRYRGARVHVATGGPYATARKSLPHIYIYIHMYVCIRMYLSLSLYIYIYIYICMCMCMCICICMHIHIYT